VSKEGEKSMVTKKGKGSLILARKEKNALGTPPHGGRRDCYRRGLNPTVGKRVSLKGYTTEKRGGKDV